MNLTLSFLFIRFIANVRGPHGLAGIMPEPQWLWLIVSLALLFMIVLASRHSGLVFSDTPSNNTRRESASCCADQE